MSDDLVNQLRDLTGVSEGLCHEAADEIERLRARVLLLEGYLNGALNVVEGFVACDTKAARTALEGKNQ